MSNPYYVDALLDGGKWGNATPGTSATVTYSFPTTIPSYYDPASTEAQTAKALTATQQWVVRDILAEYSEIAKITFTEVQGVGSLTFMGADYGTTAAGGTISGPGAGTNGSNDQSGAGDVFINTADARLLDPDAGSWAYNVYVHEIGHALGLKHPGPYNAFGGSAPGPYLPTAEDTGQYTVMSYNGAAHLAANHDHYGAAPLLYDIAALQYLYGANTATRAGDNTYAYSTTGWVEAIWDGGGVDTISAANQNTNSVIDLHAGAFSSIGGVNNIAIAYNVVIENAIGGAGNDTITGNSGANTISGALGADTMTGGAGDDTYWVDNIGDKVIEKSGEGNDTVHSSINYTMPANVNVLYLEGSACNATGSVDNNTINGNGLDNIIDGKGGADTMMGGTGNDTYYVDNAGDVVVENPGEGNDVVVSSVSYTMPANVNILYLTGSAANATGSADNNTIYGNALANVIDGKGGADRLEGMGGNDTLWGGSNADTFVFHKSSSGAVTFGKDTVSDFVMGTDKIEFDHAVFADFGQVASHLSQSDADAVITFDSTDSITLHNVTASNLHASDFLFV